jgi:hypothetical protein
VLVCFRINLVYPTFRLFVQTAANGRFPLQTPDAALGAKVRISDNAKKLLYQYYVATEKKQVADGELANVRPYASKTAEQAARIAGVMTLWADPNATEITADTMADGINLAQYSLSEAVRLVNAAVISQKFGEAEQIKEWLNKSWSHDEILPRDILQHGPNALQESEKINSALTLLKKYGWLVLLPEGTVIRGKKRKKAYRIVRS